MAAGLFVTPAVMLEHGELLSGNASEGDTGIP